MRHELSNRSPNYRRRRRAGIALIYVMIAISALIAFASLGIDVARVLLAKTQMQHATKAAALYGVTGLSDGTYISKAKTAVSDNTLDGASFSLASGDIITGTWTASGGFTAGGSNPNALQINSHLTGNSGIPLILASVVGQKYCNVTSKAVAMTQTNPPGGFVGYAGITFKNNALFGGSYNSGITTSPTQSNYNSKGMIGSNTTIDGKNNNVLHGDAMLGPQATISGVTVTGSTLYQASNLAAPTMPTWSPGTNPNSTPSAYTVSSNTTLPAGNYWFTSLTLNANLTFAGAATVYVNGSIVTDGNLTAYNSIPSNLKIYQYGSNTFGDTKNNNFQLVADVWAPTVDFAAKNNLVFAGRGFFNTITFKNNAELYYDEAFGAASGGSGVYLEAIQ